MIERSQGIWSFSHLTFQEYLVAKFFCEKQDWKGLLCQIADKYWQEIFYLVVEMLKKVDELILNMKFHIDKIRDRNNKFKEYLSWIFEKANSVEQEEYSISVIRAFYFAFALDRVFLALHNYTGFLDLSLPLRINKYFDYRLIDDIYFDAAIQRTNTIDLNVLHQISENFAEDFRSKIGLLFNRFRKLPPESVEFHQWWQKNGDVWTEEFWSVMLKYRKIRRNWNFSEDEKKILEKYNDANKLLITCLQANCNYAPETMQDIQQTLLLPIAEIQKRKREQKIE